MQFLGLLAFFSEHGNQLPKEQSPKAEAIHL